MSCVCPAKLQVSFGSVACGVWPFDALIDPLYVSAPVLLRLTLLMAHTHDEMDAISRRRHRKNRLLRQYYTPFCFLWARTHTHAHGFISTAHADCREHTFGDVQMIKRRGARKSHLIYCVVFSNLAARRVLEKVMQPAWHQCYAFCIHFFHAITLFYMFYECNGN